MMENVEEEQRQNDHTSNPTTMTMVTSNGIDQNNPLSFLQAGATHAQPASVSLASAFSNLQQQQAAHDMNTAIIQNLLAAATSNPAANNALNINTLLVAAAQAQQYQQQLLQQQAAALVAATAPFTHNLIPTHLQPSALAPSLNGTPGYQPALITPPIHTTSNPLQLQQLQAALQNCPPLPTMTVQDRPHVTPVYNGVNPNYPGLRVLNANPPIFAVDNFLTPLECQFLVTVASDSFGPAPVVGKGVGEISQSRTSSTCYLAREDLPDYMRKVSLLTGKPIEHCELPQVGRYLPSQQYLQHFDAFDTSNEDGIRFASNGGQRTITVLVYLNDVYRGGGTRFPALNLEVQPRQGMALVFFPATVDGHLDKMALHAALPAIDIKYVSQVWIRQSNYNGQPSKRLAQTMGAPLGSTPNPQPIIQAQASAGTAPMASAGSTIPNPALSFQ